MSSPALLLGLDIGTTHIKAVVHDLAGDVVVSSRRGTPSRADAEGTAMDATQLRGVVLDIAGQVATEAFAATGGRVTGIGTTGMGEAGVLTGLSGEPLAPVWAWHDRRGDVETIRRDIGEKAFQEATGMPLDRQPSLPKVLRQVRELGLNAKAVRFHSVPEWTARCLGSRPVSEMSLASRTGLLDVVTGRPWNGATHLLGGELLNELVNAGDDVGRAEGEGVAPALRGATITVAGHDHQVAALAAGAAVDGALLDSLGTAEALLRFTVGPLDARLAGSLAARGITAGQAVVPGHWCALDGLLTGFALGRLAAALGVTRTAELTTLGEQALHASVGGVRVEMDREGMRICLPIQGANPFDVSPASVWASAVEAAVQVSCAAVEQLTSLLGEHRTVMATGGWLANPAVMAAKRRQFPGLQASSLAEGGATGAAYLAGVACGLLPAPGGSGPIPWSAEAPPTSPPVNTRAGRADPRREVRTCQVPD